MRKLVIGFDGKPHGTLCVVNGKLHAEGPNVEAVRHHAKAGAEAMIHDNPSLNETGAADDILDYLAKNLQGRTHAHWEG